MGGEWAERRQAEADVSLRSSFRLFGSSSVEGIVRNLKADGSSFATEQAEV